METQLVAADWQVIEQFNNQAGQPYCTIYVDSTRSMISDVWSGMFGKQENFQKVLLSVLENVKKHQTRKWLANLTHMQGGFKGSEKWLQEFLVPQAEKAGVRYEAVVLSKDVFAKLSTADSVRKINEVAAQGSMKIGRMELRQFTDYETALTWLDAQPIK